MGPLIIIIISYIRKNQRVWSDLRSELLFNRKHKGSGSGVLTIRFSFNSYFIAHLSCELCTPKVLRLATVVARVQLAGPLWCLWFVLCSPHRGRRFP